MHGTHLRVHCIYPTSSANTLLVSLYDAIDKWRHLTNVGTACNRVHLPTQLSHVLNSACSPKTEHIFVNGTLVSGGSNKAVLPVMHLITRRIGHHVVYCPVFSYRNNVLYVPSIGDIEEYTLLMPFVHMVPVLVPVADTTNTTENTTDLVTYTRCGFTEKLYMYVKTPETFQIYLQPHTAATAAVPDLVYTICEYFKMYMDAELKLWMHLFEQGGSAAVFQTLRENMLCAVNRQSMPQHMLQRVEELAQATTFKYKPSLLNMFFAYTVLNSCIVPAVMNAFLVYENIVFKDCLQTYAVMYAYHTMRTSLTVTRNSMLSEMLDASCCKGYEKGVQTLIDQLQMTCYPSDEITLQCIPTLEAVILVQTPVVLVESPPPAAVLPPVVLAELPPPAAVMPPVEPAQYPKIAPPAPEAEQPPPYTGRVLDISMTGFHRNVKSHSSTTSNVTKLLEVVDRMLLSE